MSATLTLEAPGITPVVLTATNAQATAIIEYTVAGHGGPVSGNNQEKAVFFMNEIKKTVNYWSRQYREPDAVQAALDEVANDPDYQWEE